MASGYLQQRKLIRDNFKSLISGFTDVGTNVFSMREAPIYEGEIKVVNVWHGEDESQISRKNEVNFPRHLPVFVDVYVKKESDVDIPEDRADVIAGQIEDRILANFFLQYPPPAHLQANPQTLPEGSPGDPIVESLQLVTVSTSKSVEGLQDFVCVTLSFNVVYQYKVKTGPSVPLDLVGTTYNLKGEQDPADVTKTLLKIIQ